MPKNFRPKISVLIPSYQGKSLLAKNLTSVLNILQAGDELLIIDDASPDQKETLNYLQKRFNLLFEMQNKTYQSYAAIKNGLEIRLILNKKNLRFGKTVNLGFKLAKQALVFLLNDDVLPNQDVLTHLLPYFQKKDTFAVTCLEKNGSDKKDWSGKNKLWFEQGIFKHSKADDLKAGKNAWASGGSSLFDRAKVLKLGGFDARYQPAYWEDTDLSFQAQKQGWLVYFEPQAVVEHHHETTNASVFGQRKILAMSWRNSQKFTRKNANFKQWLAYLCWRPYWLIKEIKLIRDPQEVKNSILILLILLLATILRLYRLGQVPQGMALDEAAIGYNGYAIWQTHRDEWLNFMPVSFRSFGDYKAPLTIYLNSISTAIFGLNLWAVRLPFALAGVLAVLGSYYLARALFDQNKGQKAIWLALFLAISPWHLHYSRLAFESGLALSLSIWALAFFYRYLHQEKIKQLLIATLLAVASIYTYHSSKVFAPLIFVCLVLLNWSKLSKHWRQLLLAAAIALLALVPFIYDAIWGAGLTRAGSSFLLTDLPWTNKLSQLAINFFSYFKPNFLIGGENGGELRHSDGRFGVLSYPSLVMIVFYLLSLIKKKNNTDEKRVFQLALAWLLIALLPAIIGDGAYHSNRALLALPAYLLLVVLGLGRLEKKLSWPKKYFNQLIVLAYLFFLLLYQKNYYQNYAKISAPAFNDGYLETLNYLRQLDKSAVDKILFTNDYQHAYLYVLFANQVNPIAYHGGILAGYEFADKIDYGDLDRPKTIVVASDTDNMMHHQPDKIIYGSDGQARFRIYLPKP